MIPLQDSIPSRTTPYVNYALIGFCVLIFLFQAGDRDGSLIYRFGMVPSRISEPDQPLTVKSRGVIRTPMGLQDVIVEQPVPDAAVAPLATMLTCVFLHGSLMHLLGNMWFLYIFGDNVEDRLGHWGYLAFYLGSGIFAGLTHYLTQSSSQIPTIGASGAVAGVMGAYLLLYPHAQVRALIPIFIILQIVVLPAPVFLGIWFLMQLLQGTFSIGAGEAAGVAWWAHIGGFAAGMVVAWTLIRTGTTRPKVVVVRPGTERPRFYSYRR